MHAVVIAVPEHQPPARVGERFVLRDEPLRIGPGREARLRIGSAQEGTLRLHAVHFEASPEPLQASLSGAPVLPNTRHTFRTGDTLYVHPGLVLEFRDTPAAPPARDPTLEALALSDPKAWAVYLDFLEERGDPLGAWLRAAAAADEIARRFRLGALAESERTGAAVMHWTPTGMLDRVQITPTGIEGPPGLRWHLTQLAHLPVARLLTHLEVALFAGAMPDPDARAAEVVALVAALDAAPSLRTVSFGFIGAPRPWPRAEAAWRTLRQSATRLGEWDTVVATGRRAVLTLISKPTDVGVGSIETVLNPSRSNVGTGGSCLVQLVGTAPEVCCTLHRTSEGQWVVFDEAADPFRAAHGRLALRVNGRVTARATLNAGDVVEPVEGLTFRFSYIDHRA